MNENPETYTLQYLLREQDVISKQWENSPKIVKRTGCIKRTGWPFCQKQVFLLVLAILYSKTCQCHGFNYKPDYDNLRKQENCIKRHIKKESAKKYQRSGWIFFQKQLSEQDLLISFRIFVHFSISRVSFLYLYFRHLMIFSQHHFENPTFLLEAGQILERIQILFKKILKATLNTLTHFGAIRSSYFFRQSQGDS